MAQQSPGAFDAPSAADETDANRLRAVWARYGILGWLTFVWGWWVVFAVAVRYATTTTSFGFAIDWGVFGVAVIATTGYAWFAHYHWDTVF